MENLIAIIIGAILVNNFVLSKFLGLCPFFGVSKKTSSAIGMGIALTFVTGMSAILTWPIYHYILVPLKIEVLQITAFILVIAVFVQLVEMYLKKNLPPLYKALGIYLPLITTNCIVLGVALLNIDRNYGFVAATVFAVAAGAGFTLALFLMSGIRERLELAEVPEALKGLPIAFLTAGLMALAFLGFSGMIK